MDQASLETLLAGLGLSSMHYYGTVTSTNDLAIRWAEAGAPDMALVVADEQTAGRGRLDRRWFTPPGSALAFSLILKGAGLGGEDGRGSPMPYNPRYTTLGALAVCDALNKAFPPMQPAQIKWPNDVVALRRKLAGVLAEAQWHGSQMTTVILGIGINVAPASVLPEAEQNFPATCVETVLEKAVDRWGLLRAVLERLVHWRKRLYSAEFIQAWNLSLAFRGEWVYLSFPNRPPLEVQVQGLGPDGALRVRSRAGEYLNLQAGEIHLRPIEV